MFAREVLILKNNKYAALSMDKTQMKKDTMCFMMMSLQRNCSLKNKK